ncbi:MAG: hypothetical protein ABI551_14855 [Polyangiaceae bacterium]
MVVARIACLAVVGLALSACSSSSSSAKVGPVIDDFTMADTATVGTVTINNADVTGYDIKGTISFHDNEQNVTKYIVHLDIPGATTTDQSFDLPLSAQTKQASNVGFQFVLDQNAPKGPVDVTVTLVDAVGAKSDPEKKSTTLQ